MEKLTEEIFLQLGFTKHQTLIQNHFNLIIEQIWCDDFLYYKEISCSLCNDKGLGEYYLFIREGNSNSRHEDDVVTITRKLIFKEDLEAIIKLCKL